MQNKYIKAYELKNIIKKTKIKKKLLTKTLGFKIESSNSLKVI